MMRRLALALLAALFALIAPTVAQAEPISTAIGLTAIITSIGVSTAVAGAIGGALISAAVSIGVSLAASALLQKPDDQAADTPSGGADLSVQYGAAIARSAIMGPGAVGGHHVYTNVYGTTNEIMQCVFVIGDGQHGKLTRLKYNGKDCTLPAGGLTAAAGNYAIPEFVVFGTPAVTIRYYDGRYVQAADADLIANANPPGRWTAEHIGRGVCYLVVHQLYAEGDVGLTGVPTLMIETEGLLLYDPRKDDTNGGSGGHRWGNVSTYEPSANPAIQEYNFRRGVLVNGQRVLGMSMSPVNLILQMYFAAANINEEPIPLKEGGTEQRYRCSIAVSDDRAASSVLSAMRAATAGWSLERGGQFGPIPGVPQIPVSSLAFTDDDLIVGAPARFTKYRSRSELVTATFGQFADPAQFWVPGAFPPRENTADDALIGERIAKSLDLTQVFSSSQAQRIAESERRRTLQQGQGVATLPAKWIGVQPGDWLPFNSVRHGNMTVLVTGTTLDTARQQITLTFERTSNTVYSWTTAGELFPPEVGAPGQPGTIIMIAAGMSAVGVNVPGDGGLVTPGIHFTWTPIFDPTVEQIDFEIRKLGDATVLPFAADFPEAGSAVCSGRGIAAATTYEYRHKLFTFPLRDTPWSAWANVISGSQHVVQSALTSMPIDEVTLQMFEAGLEDYVGTQLREQAVHLDKFEQLIASTATEQEAQNWLDLQISKRADVSIRGQVSAISGSYNWRGDWSATALYYPHDMVRMPDAKLYITETAVQGTMPPALPWELKDDTAIISEQWSTFAGPDGIAAQTSDLIEARFKGGTFGSTSNDIERSLAQIVADYKAFAGPDFAAAQSSDQIQAKFNSIDVTTGNTNTALATLTSQWQAFAGPDSAAAQTSDSIEARFGSATTPISLATLITQWDAFAGPDHAAAQSSDSIEARFGSASLSLSVATLISRWEAFAGPDLAVSQSEQTTLAQVGNNTASITVNTNAIAGINGQLGATWQVRADVNNYVTGIKLYNGGDYGSFDVVADYFRIAKPGLELKTVFVVGTRDGAAHIVMHGDLFADGTITAAKINAGAINAVHVGANTIITQGANIQNLVVDNIHVRGAAITVPGFVTASGVPFWATMQTVCTINIPIRGVAGSQVLIQATASGAITPNGQATQWRIYIAGAHVSTGVSNEPSNQFAVSIVGALAITASGGDQTITVSLTALNSSASTISAIDNVAMFACAYLR